MNACLRACKGAILYCKYTDSLSKHAKPEIWFMACPSVLTLLSICSADFMYWRSYLLKRDHSTDPIPLACESKLSQYKGHTLFVQRIWRWSAMEGPCTWLEEGYRATVCKCLPRRQKTSKSQTSQQNMPLKVHKTTMSSEGMSITNKWRLSGLYMLFWWDENTDIGECRSRGWEQPSSFK